MRQNPGGVGWTINPQRVGFDVPGDHHGPQALIFFAGTFRKHLNDMAVNKSKTGFIALIAWLMATDCAFGAETITPTEILRAAPVGTRLVLYKASGNAPDADAVAVYEAAADLYGSRKRELIVFRKQEGTFKEVVRSDRIIACSTCSPERGDAFMDGEQVTLTPGHLDIVQAYGAERPTDVTFAFAYRDGQWRVTAATRHDGDGRTTELARPSSGLLKDFDGGWRQVSLWNALLVNDAKHSFRFILDKPSERALESGIAEALEADHGWRVAARVKDGCLALARDVSGTFFPVAKPNTSAKNAASQDAMAACGAQGKGQCESVRTSCSTGPI